MVSFFVVVDFIGRLLYYTIIVIFNVGNCETHFLNMHNVTYQYIEFRNYLVIFNELGGE